MQRIGRLVRGDHAARDRHAFRRAGRAGGEVDRRRIAAAVRRAVEGRAAAGRGQLADIVDRRPGDGRQRFDDVAGGILSKDQRRPRDRQQAGEPVASVRRAGQRRRQRHVHQSAFEQRELQHRMVDTCPGDRRDRATRRESHAVEAHRRGVRAPVNLVPARRAGADRATDRDGSAVGGGPAVEAVENIRQRIGQAAAVAQRDAAVRLVGPLDIRDGEAAEPDHQPLRFSICASSASTAASCAGL